jgi:hypothetical protein
MKVKDQRESGQKFGARDAAKGGADCGSPPKSDRGHDSACLKKKVNCGM